MFQTRFVLFYLCAFRSAPPTSLECSPLVVHLKMAFTSFMTQGQWAQLKKSSLVLLGVLKHSPSFFALNVLFFIRPLTPFYVVQHMHTFHRHECKHAWLAVTWFFSLRLILEPGKAGLWETHSTGSGYIVDYSGNTLFLLSPISWLGLEGPQVLV